MKRVIAYLNNDFFSVAYELIFVNILFFLVSIILFWQKKQSYFFIPIQVIFIKSNVELVFFITIIFIFGINFLSILKNSLISKNIYATLTLPIKRNLILFCQILNCLIRILFTFSIQFVTSLIFFFISNLNGDQENGSLYTLIVSSKYFGFIFPHKLVYIYRLLVFLLLISSLPVFIVSSIKSKKYILLVAILVGLIILVTSILDLKNLDYTRSYLKISILLLGVLATIFISNKYYKEGNVADE